MAADLRFVMDAAEADAHELAVHRARDRLAERGLADAGRPDEAQDGRLAVGRELAHREIFDDPALDLLKPEMILVEDAPRRRDVDAASPRAGSTAARPASRDRCAPCRIRRPLPASAAGAAAPCAPDPRPPWACSALAMASPSSAISVALPSSPSPSWRWIAAICSRSSTSRLRESSAALVSRPISCDSRSTSIRWASRRETPLQARRKIDGFQDLLLLVGRRVHIGRDHIGEGGRGRRRPGSPPAVPAAPAAAVARPRPPVP